MKTNIYLHIGTPKTGTSAIQKFLLNNDKLLDEHGFVYPSHGLDPNGISSGNGAYLINLMKADRKEEAKKHLDKLLENSKGKTLILSSEDFYSYPELTYELMPDAKIIVYIREQSDLIRADYNQSIKRHFQVHFFERALNAAFSRNDGFFNFDLLKTWYALYGSHQIILHVYDIRNFNGGNIVYDFLNSLGINDENAIHVDSNKVNTSYHEDALRFKLWFNRLIKGKETEMKQLHNNIDYALQAYSMTLENSGKGIKFCTYTKEQFSHVQQFYKECNKSITDMFFPDRKDTLFNVGTDMEHCKRYGGLNELKILEIGKYIKTSEANSFHVLQDLIKLNLEDTHSLRRSAAKKLSPLIRLKDD